MTRRKSRPLISTEIFFSSQEQSENAKTFGSFPQGSSQQAHLSCQSTSFSSQRTPSSLPTILPIKAPNAMANPSNTQGRAEQYLPRDAPRGFQYGSVNNSQINQVSAPAEGPVQAATSEPVNLVSVSHNASTKRRPGFLSNRRSAPFILHNEQSDATRPPREDPTQADCVADFRLSSQVLNRTSSQVRLSMSLDGKAEVTTGTGMTPSPPRCQPIPLSNSAPRTTIGLQRSLSAVEPIRESVEEPFRMPYLRRPMAGRSRDARTWEFYCDSDARNALTEQAQREEKGSATAAIGLLRSRSQNNKVMTPISNKRNAHARNIEQTKKLKGDGQYTGRRKLARAMTSLARLQTTNGKALRQIPAKNGDEDPKSTLKSAIYHEYDGDSDKENWEPGTQTSNIRRRIPAEAQRVDRILEDSLRVPSQSLSFDAVMSCRSSTKTLREEKENSSFEVDDEEPASMVEGAPHEEELDCVQNLLSLSQAAWR